MPEKPTAEKRVGVQEADKVDLAVVAAELPRGRADVTAVKGGLDVQDAEQGANHQSGDRARAARKPRPL